MEVSMASKQRDNATKLATDIVEAFNEGDWERLKARVAPDVVYEETGTGRRIEGADAYVELCMGWRQTFADVKGTIHNTAASGGTVAQEITWEGTHTGPLVGPGGTLAPTGKRAPVQATMWFTVEGDRVREIHHHLDLLTLLQTLGALPAPAHTGA
jgi:steroid delta-isomerase-like uncharacterized protein